MSEHGKAKFDADRARFLEQAQTRDDGEWTKHTAHHWSRSVNGERLDYWPSRKKFQWRGKVMRGLKAMYSIITGSKTMKPYTPATNKGREVGGDDIHHRTADQPRTAANASAKAMRKAARQEGKQDRRVDCGECPYVTSGCEAGKCMKGGAA